MRHSRYNGNCGNWRASPGSPVVLIALLCLHGLPLHAVDLITLSPQNHDEYAPRGKEADAIWGDYVLRNDRIVAVIANPDLISGRSASRWANLPVNGCIIDLTKRDRPNDQLGAFYPGVRHSWYDAPQKQRDFYDESQRWQEPERKPVHGPRVTLSLEPIEVRSGKMLKTLRQLPPSLRGKPEPTVQLCYTLEDGWAYVRLDMVFRNPGERTATLNPVATLRADHTFQSGCGWGGQLCWVYDRWFRQAYGVVTIGHQLAGVSEKRFGAQFGDAKSITMLPGGTFVLTRYVVPGDDLFEISNVAATLLKIPQKPTRVDVRDANGPVSEAPVEAFVGDRLCGAGYTGRDGSITIRLPDGEHEVRVSPFGRQAQTKTLAAATARTVRFDFEAAAVADIAVTHEGQPVPCKIEFRGRNGTPDPFFFPATGNHQVRDLVYTRTGQIQQTLPPGKYDVIITHGPELDALVQSIEVVPGKKVKMQAALRRTVDTRGWVSADFHNHSTLSGTVSRFFIKGYRKDPAVDGDSTASTLGRVLNLLCEHLEFAVPAEHNFVTSYQPILTQLEATKLMATVPGIGLTAGRRHTIDHQNAFPVKCIPGMEDGGALQRPEHILQRQWLINSFPPKDKFVQAKFPSTERVGLPKGVDALDVEDLLAILDTPRDAEKHRVHEWLEMLKLGYRLPSNVGSGAFDNFHGSGGVRNYIRCSTDDPAGVTPEEIIREVHAGHVVMTTGPFLTVTLRAGEVEGMPGDEIAAPGGAVTADLRVQWPNWITIERVEVWINGEPNGLAFEVADRAKPDPHGLGKAGSFTKTVPLKLAKDSFVMVVAAGSGPNLRARSGAEDDRLRHVAVSNPVWVDVDGNGYQPHSPLDDKVNAWVSSPRALLAMRNAEPGLIRVHLQNLGDEIAEDAVTLDLIPADAMRIVGERTRSYRLHPNEDTRIDFEVVFTDEYLARGLPIIAGTYVDEFLRVRVPRSATGQGRRGAGMRIKVEHGAPQLPPISDAKVVPAALRQLAPLLAHPGRTPPTSEIRTAVAGDNLVVLASVKDSRIVRDRVVWQGSCVEVFGAMERERPIGQLYLLPAAGQTPAQARRRVKGQIVDAPGVHVHSEPAKDGYELSALIPLSMLPIDVDAERFLLEFRVTAAKSAGGKHQRGSAFRNGRPDIDHGPFGRFRLLSKVRPKLELLHPIVLGKGASPGRVRLTLRNRSAGVAKDQVAVSLEQRNVGSIGGETVLSWTLDPGEALTRELEIRASGEANVPGLNLLIPRSPQGETVRWVRPQIPIHRPLKKLSVAGLAHVKAALAGEKTYVMRWRDRAIAALRFAIADDLLAVDATVADARPAQVDPIWKGSSVEIFGVSPAGGEIGQVFLVPAVGDSPARTHRAEKGQQPLESSIKLQTRAASDGYELQALIPLRLLKVGTGPLIRLEFQIGFHPSADAAKPTHMTLFGSKLAYLRSADYGWFNVEQ